MPTQSASQPSVSKPPSKAPAPPVDAPPPDLGALVIDTIAPLHHTTGMRLTINLEPELYAVAVSLAKAEDCSISAAVNRLVRRALPGAEPHRAGIAARMERRNGLLVSRGSEVITPEMVQRVEAEDDAR